MERQSIALVLLEEGLDINEGCNHRGNTALAKAVKHGNLSMVRLLIGVGVPVLHFPYELFDAASSGWCDIAQLL